MRSRPSRRPLPLCRVLALVLLVGPVSCTQRSRRGTTNSYTPPPPPCQIDGVYQTQAQRTQSSGSVCNLNDLQQLQEEITLQRTGLQTAYVHQRGEYAHQSNLDPNSCLVWTDRTPTHSRQVIGATVGGYAAYRVNVRPDGTLGGTLQLFVQSSSPFVPGCTASFNIFGRRVR
jgi:hypothetical protein